MRTPCALLILTLLAGCQPKATFDVTVTNASRSPLTVGLVKDGPPAEEAFADISRLAIESDLAHIPPWGFVVPPGRTAGTGSVTGAFPQGTLAYLRVYRGKLTNAEMIATSAPHPGRLDILLYPGQTEIRIRDDDASGKLAADRRQTSTPAR
jgi:hypothetical protein